MAEEAPGGSRGHAGRTVGPPAASFTLVCVLLVRGQTLWPRNTTFRRAVLVTGTAGPQWGDRPLGLIRGVGGFCFRPQAEAGMLDSWASEIC